MNLEEASWNVTNDTGEAWPCAVQSSACKSGFASYSRTPGRRVTWLSERGCSYCVSEKNWGSHTPDFISGFNILAQEHCIKYHGYMIVAWRRSVSSVSPSNKSAVLVLPFAPCQALGLL